MLFYRIKGNELYDFAEYKYADDCLETDIITQRELDADRNKVIVQDGVLVLNPNYEEEQAEREKERIQELYMTRSDFFDGTIRAFGLDDEGLLQIIIAYFAGSNDYDELQEKIAINNFKNALNFYRKYPLFNMLGGVPLPISETETITITSEQWDNFFNETDKGNPEAYKELLPAVEEIPAKEQDSEAVDGGGV